MKKKNPLSGLKVFYNGEENMAGVQENIEEE